jgi:hypothetical protein
MSEFIVKIEDKNVQTILKAAATDILKDYEADDLTNDEEWLKARKEALLKDRQSQFLKSLVQ